MRIFFALILSCASVLGADALLRAGDTLPSLALVDQNGKLHTNDSSIRVMVFAPDRAASQVVTDAFKGQTSVSWKEHGMVYVADIKAMPSLVASMFALPEMRKQPYPILLGKKAGDTALLPRQTNCVTVIGVKVQQITTIKFMTNAAELRKVLE